MNNEKFLQHIEIAVKFITRETLGKNSYRLMDIMIDLYHAMHTVKGMMYDPGADVTRI